jgi:hypothetical protein
MAHPNDPFGTADLRARVLAAWRASPARFRADANLEDDLALTGYRDRVVIELAQNAADAATRAGVVGRLVLSLVGDVLTASNTGAPLDRAGVESLSVARASAKAQQLDTVGRYGVGFAAVLAVSDEPSIASTTGAVRWSRTDARRAIEAVDELHDELASRGDRIPVLRLPFAVLDPAVAAAIEPGATTTVRLPLRDADARLAVTAALRALDQTVLLALPAIGELVVSIDGAQRRITAAYDDDAVAISDGQTQTRWRLAAGSGPLDEELLADRPLEERRFDRWQVTWALPLDDDDRLAALAESVPALIRAPTVIDDAMSLPVVLIASYPLDSARRRVVPGRLADTITAHAADVLARSLAELPPDPHLLSLVPTGFPVGEVDAALREALLSRLRETSWLPAAGEPELRQRPAAALLVPEALVEVLADIVPGVLPAVWSRPDPELGARLGSLGVRRFDTAEIVALVAGAAQPPTWWRRLYAALEQSVAPGADREDLAELGVPLVDGMVVTGPRGLALPDPDSPVADLSAIGIRVVHPDAVHPLLRSLGAVDAEPRLLLEQPQVRSAVESSYDAEDPAPVAEATLSLLAAATVAPGELPWLADLALTDRDGEWRPAGELVLPDGRMAAAIAADSAFRVVAPGWVDTFGAAALTAAGVLDGLVVLRDADATGPDHDLDDEADWWATLPADAAVTEFAAVRDLEQVRPDALADLLHDLARPPLRAAVVEPALVLGADGTRGRTRSYTAWWLASRHVLSGERPRDLRLPTDDPALRALYAEAPADFDAEFLRAIGVVGSLADAEPADVLERLADDRRVIGREALRAVYSWLADQPPASARPPSMVRAVAADRITIVPRERAVVLDAPDLADLLGTMAIVPISTEQSVALAEFLDLPLASDLAAFEVVSSGSPYPAADLSTGDDSAATAADRWPPEVVVHDGLRVLDVDGSERPAPWRLVDDTLHVDRASLSFGLGRGSAWWAGEWACRHRRTEVCEHPDLGMIRAAEDDLDCDRRRSVHGEAS